MQAEARRFTLWILLAAAGWIVFGALRPDTTHSLSMEHAPQATAHNHFEWYSSNYLND